LRELTVPLVGEIKLRLRDVSSLNSDDEEVMRGFLRDVAEAMPKMSIPSITRTRVEAIRRALTKMKPEKAAVVALKLKVPLAVDGERQQERPRNRAPAQAQSWRAKPGNYNRQYSLLAEQPTRERELPRNWRS